MAAGEPCVLSDNPTWIVDPVDGTTNFVHGYHKVYYIVSSLAMF